MTLLTSPLLQMSETASADPEVELVTRLTSWVRETGVCIDPIPVVNLYVALKSKPLAILAGPADSGKLAMVQCLSHVLLGGDCLQCQVMTGHPWWANNCDNLVTFTGMHTRFLTEKLLAVMEEASLPKNRCKVFIVCLAHISPAELLSFFSGVAYQLHQRQITHLGDVQLPAPVPFPPNLFLTGTMDASKFLWWDDDLLAKTTVITWSEGHPCLPILKSMPSGEDELIRSCIRNRQAAYQKFFHLAGHQKQPVSPAVQVEALLREYGIPLTGSVMDEVVLYLANAWSLCGQGLFHQELERNLAIAMDLAITQILLTRVVDYLSNSTQIIESVKAMLGLKFPYSLSFLETMY